MTVNLFILTKDTFKSLFKDFFDNLGKIQMTVNLFILTKDTFKSLNFCAVCYLSKDETLKAIYLISCIAFMNLQQKLHS